MGRMVITILRMVADMELKFIQDRPWRLLARSRRCPPHIGQLDSLIAVDGSAFRHPHPSQLKGQRRFDIRTCPTFSSVPARYSR